MILKGKVWEFKKKKKKKLRKKDKINILIKKYEIMESKLIDDGRPKDDIVELCLNI